MATFPLERTSESNNVIHAPGEGLVSASSLAGTEVDSMGTLVAALMHPVGPDSDSSTLQEGGSTVLVAACLSWNYGWPIGALPDNLARGDATVSGLSLARRTLAVTSDPDRHCRLLASDLRSVSSWPAPVLL
jgi:hypothetical protein